MLKRYADLLRAPNDCKDEFSSSSEFLNYKLEQSAKKPKYEYIDASKVKQYVKNMQKTASSEIFKAKKSMAEYEELLKD